MSITRYKVGEVTYDIPEEKVDSFLQARPNAVVVDEGKQDAPQITDATVEQNTTASDGEDTSSDILPQTQLIPEVEPVFVKDLTTEQLRDNVKWSNKRFAVVNNLNKKYSNILD